MAFGMTWEILWALILGFALSGLIQTVVTKSEMTRLLPDDSPRLIDIACGLRAWALPHPYNQKDRSHLFVKRSSTIPKRSVNAK
jgi:hypothetical protein